MTNQPRPAEVESVKLTELLARLEAATGPDRELDRDLAVALMGWCLHPHGRQRDDSAQSDTGYTCLDCGADSWGNTGPSGQKRHATIPDLTASLDAALALVERVLPGVWWHVAKGKLTATEPLYGALLYFTHEEELGAGEHETSAAIALLCALLRALITTRAALQQSTAKTNP